MAAGNERTTHKVGISLVIHGQPDVDYAFERYYHDPLVDDRGVIYIRGHVPLSLEYNEMHRRNDGPIIGIPGPGEPGIIRYKVDLDWNWRLDWCDGRTIGERDPARRAPAYVTPFSFADLQYFDGKPVLGNIGPSRPFPPYPDYGSDDFYFAGIADEFGDEWHILTVASDDTHETLHYRHWASDGRVHLFVVNPRTPAISFHAAASGGEDRPQWYTTPAKTYFVPKIHKQTTYVTRGIEVRFTNITNSEQVMWRIDEIDGHNEWRTYSQPVALDQLDFEPDTLYTLRYRIGSTGPEKTRTLHYDPSFPSDAEPRPSRVLFPDETVEQRVRQLIAGGSEPHQSVYNGLDTGDVEEMTGTRLATTDGVLENAFVAYIEGVDQALAQARAARIRMLDNQLNLDPVGDEGSHNTANPARELNTHGYYFVPTPMGVALGYDLLIDKFRYPEYPDGFTPIEDYKIRDNLGMFALSTLQRKTHGWPNRDPAATDTDRGTEMWITAREMGLMVVAMVMPKYDTPYFGTAGTHSSSGSLACETTHKWAPYPDLSLSWWESVNSEQLGAGYYHVVTNEPTPRWLDRPGYWGGKLMGWLFYVMSNARANYDGHHFDHLERAYQRAMDGTLEVGKRQGSDPPYVHHYTALAINEHFPGLAEQAETALRNATEENPAPGEKTLDYSVWYHGVYSLVYCRPDWRQHTPSP